MRKFFGGILLVALSATAPLAVVAEQIVAIVNGQLLFQSDLLRHHTFFSDTAPTSLRNDVEKFVDYKLLLIEAKRFVLAPPEEGEVELFFKEVQKKFSDEALFLNAIKESGLTIEGLKREIFDRLWVKKLIRDRITFFIFITDEEISQYHQQHQNDFVEQTPEEGEAKIRAILEKEKETIKVKEYLSRIASQANIEINIR